MNYDDISQMAILFIDECFFAINRIKDESTLPNHKKQTYFVLVTNSGKKKKKKEEKRKENTNQVSNSEKWDNSAFLSSLPQTEQEESNTRDL